MIRDDQPIILTRDEIRHLICQGVEDAMTRFGMDASNPLEMQRDFQHLRDWRLSVQSAKEKGTLAIIGVLVSGMVGALLLGLKVILNQ